jgi:hypothetical protein
MFSKEIEPQLKTLKKKDPNLESALALKILVKSYTSDSLYRKIGECLSRSNF